jgi:hypothetical protein
MKCAASRIVRMLTALVVLTAAATTTAADDADALAVKGEAVANADPLTAELRERQPEGPARRGFDIATGIFGDPARGALGNTATGPGSLRIRNALSAAGQRGFDASVAFHLSANKPRLPSAAWKATARHSTVLPERTVAQLTPSRLPRVPSVVGLYLPDAENALHSAGYEPELIYEDEPDPSVTHGHVRATDPPAGTLAAGGVVEVRIPRAASRVGIGSLSTDDLARRTGFDLDEARYEEIYRGADIVLRKHEQEARIDARGHTYYAGGGTYVEPSDGAVLASLNDVRAINRYGLGSYPYYEACNRTLKETRAAVGGINLDEGGEITTICVGTSKHQLTVVEFRSSDNPIGRFTNYKFHHALFTRQFEPVISSPIQLRR